MAVTKSIFGLFAAPPMPLEAQRWAERLGLPLLERLPQNELVFVYDQGGLGLLSTAPGAPGAVRVDFAALHYRRKGGSLRKEAAARALGLRGDRVLNVVDATAGLGTDAFMLASLGASVRLIERSEAVAALLEDGLARAAQDPELAPIVERMALYCGDALAWLPRLAQMQAIDAVYLDPMYPEAGTKGQVKKEMQILRALIGHDNDPSALLAEGLKVAPRVAVKRPRKAPSLGGRPSHSLEGRSTRFDVYVSAGPDTASQA